MTKEEERLTFSPPRLGDLTAASGRVETPNLRGAAAEEHMLERAD
jgi:hypothetical protein